MTSQNHFRSPLVGSLIAGLALNVWLTELLSSTAKAQGEDPFCPPGQPVRFVLGVAA
jgi:hypothetical protein